MVLLVWNMDILLAISMEIFEDQKCSFIIR